MIPKNEGSQKPGRTNKQKLIPGDHQDIEFLRALPIFYVNFLFKVNEPS